MTTQQLKITWFVNQYDCICHGCQTRPVNGFQAGFEGLLNAASFGQMTMIQSINSFEGKLLLYFKVLHFIFHLEYVSFFGKAMRTNSIALLPKLWLFSENMLIIKSMVSHGDIK